jgi:nicotinate-nucleotide--dimethylbenzimidazole phosphoribosyltransferase
MTELSQSVVAPLAAAIAPPSAWWHQRARAHLDTLTKPLGSLGRLEELAAQMVAVLEERHSRPLRKAVYVFAADHGITAEGVSAYPRAVTQQMVLNFLAQGAAVSVLARLHGASLHVVDVGVDADFASVEGLLHRKVARGTANMLHGPAMTDAELAQALQAGADLAAEAAVAGETLLAVGEMGIGNTTAASVITCALTGAPAGHATGRGTGIDDAAHQRKVAVVEAVLQRHLAGFAGVPAPLDLLRCAGGLEIAAMTGFILGAAAHRRIVVLDGFISTAAAALAVALAPAAQGHLIAGHRSQEPGHQLLLQRLQLTPVLTLEMRLGEASGAVLAMPVLASALDLYNQMATFASANVSQATAQASQAGEAIAEAAP